MWENRDFSDLSFQYFLSEEKLMGCRCRNCGTAYIPPKPICTNCYHEELEWIELPETGKLAAFTCISVVPPAMAQEGFGRKKPYFTGVVELAEGLRVDARINGIDPRKLDAIRVGMPMRTDFIHKETDGIKSTVLAFRPA